MRCHMDIRGPVHSFASDRKIGRLLECFGPRRCVSVDSRAQARKTDPPLTRRALSGYGWFRKSLPELVELTGIEPVTS
jgi:hypothetical protein